MHITFDVCDRCGNILNNAEYEIRALKKGENDGGYRLCYDCYFKLTSILNNECFGKSDRIMKEFVKTFNEQFNKEQFNG
jgi:hypothetical protein